jgi:DNA-binding winged helix-turn-helix (wHTH) protein
MVHRFGTFALDAAALELRRNGMPRRLRPQPCAALAYLVERSGQFVSRAELYRALWGDETFVQYDQGLNSCIRQIRAALGDSRTAPRYVETLTRRGYRFIAPVTTSGSAEDTVSAPAERRAGA